MPLFLGYLCSQDTDAWLVLIQLSFSARGLIKQDPLLWLLSVMVRA